MTILRDLSIIWSLIHVLVLFVFLYEPRYSRKKTMICTTVTMIPWTILNAALYILLGPEKMAQMLLITATLPSLVFFFFMAKHRDGRFFFTFCFADTVSYGVIVLTSVMDYYLFGNQFIFMFISRLVLFPFMEFLAWRYLREFYRDLQRTVKKGWGVFAIVSALFYVLLVLMSSYPVIFYENPGQTPMLVLAVTLMALMYVNVFQVLHNQQKVFYAMEAERRMNQLVQLLHNELSAGQEYVFNAKRYRHDMHHHGKVIYEYLQQNDVEAAKNYLKIYRDQLEDAALENYCAHPTVNALLRITARQCKAKNISFTAEGDVPESLPFSDPEIGTVLGNLLENAREAAEKTRNGFVRIRAEERGNVLYVELRNSVDGRVKFDGDMPRSTKQTGGIGIQSVNAALARYDGMISFRQEGRTFLARLILPL